MATKKAQLDSEQLRREFLECPLCFEKFSKPKVLPCQHSFCLQCLRDYVATRGQASTLPCPLCNQIARIPENDVSKFPNNFTLSNLSHFVKVSAQIPEDVTSRRQQCEACREDGLLQTFCSTCVLWLCRSCSTAHKNVPSLSSHCLRSNMEVNKQCTDMASQKEKEVKRLQGKIKHKLTCLTELKQKIHCVVDDAKQQIKATAEEARQIINIKENTLLQELSKFEENEIQNQTAMYESIKEIDVNIDNMIEVINEMKKSSSGRENQCRIGIVKEFLTNSNSGTYPCLPVSIEEYIPVYFASRNFLGDLKNLDMGYLHGVHGEMNTLQLIDRPVRLQEIALQGMGGPVSLAYSKFTGALVGVVEDSVTVINPNSGERKPFLSLSSKREIEYPRRIAYSEDGRRLFVIEGGEGKRVITSYTHDGMFQSVITCGISRPTGLAVYGSRIFVCDWKDKCVYTLNISGEVLKVLKESPDHKALFTCPLSISVGKNGRFAVSDDFDRVHIFDKDYTLLYTYVPVIADRCLTDVQVLPDGSVVMCDRNNGLHYISPDFSKIGLMNFENISSLSPWSTTIHEQSHTIYIGTFNENMYFIKY